MDIDDLVYDKIMDGESLVQEIRGDRGSVIDDGGKSYWPETIDVSKRYRVRKYEHCRALQYYPVVSYKIEEIKVMTREEAYDLVRKESCSTQNGLMVNISIVEKVIETVSSNDELKEKAIDGIYSCEGNSFDWMQLGDAEYYIDIALGIESEIN